MTDTEQPNNQAADAAASQPVIEPALSLEEQLTQAQVQAAEYLDNWRRAIAELSNARKRMQREAEEQRAAASVRVLEKLLPVVDDMERAFAHIPADQVETDWVDGFRMIQRKLHGLLESEGVTIIPAAGQPFDPAMHHAVTHEETDGFDDGQVIAELAHGYMLNEKVLRPAMVRVAKGN